jgi:lauroyl/myristoyl acyltransferase
MTAVDPIQKQIRKVANRMERQNYLESRPLSDAKVRAVVKHNLSVAHPEKTGEELDKMVNEILKSVMQPYKGPAATKPPPKPILGRDLYDAERRQTVKNMRSRRR